MSSTTPHAKDVADLLGGSTCGSVTLTRDELKAIRKLYGFTPEKPNTRPEVPPMPDLDTFSKDHAGRRDFEEALKDWERACERIAKWEDPMPLMQAAADRNALRHAEHDGLRVVAWLAKHCSKGEDPLKVVIQLAGQDGWDVEPEDAEWATGYGDENSD